MAGDAAPNKPKVRRLAAIMSADIAGYSRHMGADEEGTHARLTLIRRDIVEPTIAEHNGTVIKHMGDGFLATFDSPLEATRCGIVIQESIAARNVVLADKTHRLQYRIGINLGDVIVESNDIFGDGVNIAARLQTAAEPGGVNISGGIYEQVKNKLVCGYQSLGDEKLKNITDPVRIYRVLPDPAAMGRADHRLKRFVRVAIPTAGACLLTFGFGIWYAASLFQRPSIMASTTPSSDQVTPEPARASLSSSPPQARVVPETRVAVVAPPASVQGSGPSTPANSFRDCEHCPEMLKLPGGAYKMGDPEDWTEKPVHEAVVGPFALGRFPVTIGEWNTCVAAKACRYQPIGDDDVPVHNVSWDDAQQYITWLAQITLKPYRLPSEVEWEYAARAGTATGFWWGDNIVPGNANCKGCGDPYDPEQPVRIGLLRPNPLRLYDMGGGVAEWVSDCWHSSYQGAPRTGSWESPNCREHVVRGGSWRSDPEDIKVTSRAQYDTGVRYPANGFRVALTER